MPTDCYDTLIAGSGFSGSLLALMLARRGRQVLLIEKDRHPRFAIGESSTPVADILLRRIADSYGLPWLRDFSRYGTWKERYPQVSCGLKRGFSFYPHLAGEAYRSDPDHSRELLVAASASDSQSDANWFRSDFDAFLVGQVRAAGIACLEACEVHSLKEGGPWQLELRHAGGRSSVQARFLVDATGSGALAGGLLATPQSAEGFLTHSMAVYSHVERAPLWMDFLKELALDVSTYPYHPDHSALHQLLEEGWMWVLRFDNGLTSLGLLLDPREKASRQLPAETLWKQTLSRYPTLQSLYAELSPAAMPGRWLKTGRLQRRLQHCSGPGWAALPHAAGFVDPMFSPGIAHTLSGLSRLSEHLLQPFPPAARIQEQLRTYEDKVFTELAFIDRLIAGSYQCLGRFELFNAWSMLYFAATIAHETRLLRGETPACFLEADQPNLNQTVEDAYRDLQRALAQPGRKAVQHFIDCMRRHIAPYQQAGLLDPSLKNLYAHTAAAV